MRRQYNHSQSNIKNYGSRKPFYLVSARYKQRIANEVKRLHNETGLDNLLVNHGDEPRITGNFHIEEPTVVDPLDDPSSSNVQSFSDNVVESGQFNDALKEIEHSIVSNNINNDAIFEYSSESEHESADDSSSYSDGHDNCEFTFKERLAKCFKQFGINQVQGNAILSTLRTHNCFSYLPKDVRTLFGTPRTSAEIRTVEPGEYLHIGFETGITQTLRDIPKTVIPNTLRIDVSTDGASLDKDGKIQIWPIQCRIVNIPQSTPEIVGIYRGRTKPQNAMDFFQDFMDEVNCIITNGGIVFEGTKMPIVLRSFIADAPARALILNHKSHISSNPCSKCKVSAHYADRRCVFLGTDHCARTDEGYAQRIYSNHQKEGDSPLFHLPIGAVSQVPFECMHLVYLGVVKKLLSAWVSGKFCSASKLPDNKIA